MATPEEILLQFLEEDEARRRTLLRPPPTLVKTPPPEEAVRTPLLRTPSRLRLEAPPTAPARLQLPPSVEISPKKRERAVSRIARTIERGREDVELARRSEEAGLARSLLGAFTTGVGGIVAGIPEAINELAVGAFEAVGGEIETPREDQPGIILGEDIRRGFRGPVNPEFEESFAVALAQGAGSMVGFIAGGFAGRGLAALRAANQAKTLGLTGVEATNFIGRAVTRAGTASAAILGAAAEGAEGARDAARNQADGETRFKAFLLDAGLGLTEAVPIAAMFNRLDRGSGGFVSRWLKDRSAKAILAQGVVGAFEEGIQEFIQNAGSNAVAKALFDADRAILDSGVAQGTAVGGILGFAMNAMFTALGGGAAGRRRAGLDAPPGPASRAEAAASGITPPPARPEEEAVSAAALFGAEATELDEAFADLRDIQAQTQGVAIQAGSPAAQRLDDVVARITELGGDVRTDPRADLEFVPEGVEALAAEPLSVRQQAQLEAEAEAAAITPPGGPAVLEARRTALTADLERVTDPAARSVIQSELRGVEAQIAGEKAPKRTKEQNRVLARTPLQEDTADIVLRKLGGLDTSIETDFEGRLKGTDLAGRKNILGTTVADLERPGSGVTLDTVAETFFELGFIPEVDQALASNIIERIEQGELVRNPRSAATEADLEAEAQARQEAIEAREAEVEAGEAKTVEQLTTELTALDQAEAERITARELPEPETAVLLQDAIQRLTPAQAELEIEGEERVEPTAEARPGEPAAEPGVEPAAVVEAEREPIGAEPAAEPAAGAAVEPAVEPDREPAVEPTAAAPAAAEAVTPAAELEVRAEERPEFVALNQELEAAKAESRAANEAFQDLAESDRAAAQDESNPIVQRLTAARERVAAAERALDQLVTGAAPAVTPEQVAAAAEPGQFEIDRIRQVAPGISEGNAAATTNIREAIDLIERGGDVAEIRAELEQASTILFQGGQVPLAEVVDEILESQNAEAIRGAQAQIRGEVGREDLQQPPGRTEREAEADREGLAERRPTGEPITAEQPPAAAEAEEEAEALTAEEAAAQRAKAEAEDPVNTRKAEDEAKAIVNATTDVRKSILDSPEKLRKLTGLSQDDFTTRARPLIEEYLQTEQRDAITAGDDTRLTGLDTVASDNFLDDLFFASLRVEVEKRADRESRDKKKTAKAERERGKKFGSTGESLRRFWEQKSNLAGSADSSSLERFINDITRATQRADLFPVERLSKDGTPGLKRYMEFLRGYIQPFKRVAIRQLGGFSRFKTFDENIQDNIFGDEDAMTELREEAVNYIKTVTELAQAIEGATKIDDAVNLLATALGVDERTDLGKRVAELGGQSRWIRGIGRTFTVKRMIETEDRPDEEVKGTRAKAMRRPKRRIEDLNRENRDDVRADRNIEPIQLKNEFNFADITIGGYVTSTQERLHLNGSFEALHDLAKVLKIPVTALSHGGKLHYSIGALGHGRHSAHYAPEQPGPGGVGLVQAINVTNTKGDGTVAHEWGHSLDFNLRVFGNNAEAMSEVFRQLQWNVDIDQIDKTVLRTLNSLLDGNSRYQHMKRKPAIEHAKLFLDFVIRDLERGRGNHLRRTEYFTEARRSGNADYWASDEELFARAFESWVFDEMLDDNNSSSEYLVTGWVADGATKNPPYKFAPYPTGDERARFAQLFETLRDGLEVADNGTISLKKGTTEKLREQRQALLTRVKELQSNLAAYVEQREQEKQDKIRARQLEERQKEEDRAAATQAAIDEALGGETADDAEVKASEIHTLSDEELDDLLDDVTAEGQDTDADTNHSDRTADQISPESSDDEQFSGVEDHILAGTQALHIELDKIWNSTDSLNNPAFFKLADAAFGGTRGAGVYTTKDAYDAMELSLNRAVREQIELGNHGYDRPDAAIVYLNDLTAAAPTQANRSEEQVKFQQFSTPPPLAFVVGWVANINENDQVLEPSAGTGSLVIHAQASGASVIANELNLRRGTLLAQLGVNPRSEDAEFINSHIQGDERPSVVLMNPPFSASPGTQVRNKTKRGAQHVEKALKALRPGGRLVGIVGKGMEIGKPAFRKWWEKVGNEHTVRAAIRISGREYQKFGTTFDNVLIVIDKVPPGGDGIPSQITTVETVAELVPLLQRIRDGRPELSEPTPRQQAIEDGDIEVGGADRADDGTRTTTDDSDAGRRAARADQSGSGTATAPDDRASRRGRDTRADDGIPGSERRRADSQRDDAAKTKGTDRERAGVGEGAAPTNVGVGRDLSVGELAKELGKEGITVADETLKGLVKIFGGNKLKSFPAGFDEDSYQQAKPHFQAAYKNAVAMGQTAKELFRALVRAFGEGIKPYLKRFAQDLREEQNLQTVTTPAAPDPDTAEGMEDSPTAAVPPEKAEELTDDIYEIYGIKHGVEGSQPHPAELVETATMGEVEIPDTDYQADLPQDLIESGEISDAQIEPVILAGHTHSQTLPSDRLDNREIRRGLLIGDGTGLGKTRELLGIVLDNIAKGRKKIIYVSKNQDLINDLRENWEMMLQDPKFIFPLNRTPVTKDISASQGIVFTTYSTLGRSLSASEKAGTTEFTKDRGVVDRVTGQRGIIQRTSTQRLVSVKFRNERKARRVDRSSIQVLGEKTAVERTRTQQLEQWVGPDFEGVMIFDEAHGMANAIELKGARGVAKPSDQARAGLQLASTLPGARVVYATATAATEVRQLAYMDRLGLWGRGTAFADKKDFISKIEEGGVAAMEVIARDMKALGVYMARTISFKGVGYDSITHNLTAEQTTIYNELVRAWQAVLNNIENAMSEEVTGSGNNGQAKSRIRSRIWGFQQRFFNQIITTMKMPSVIEDANRRLAEGSSVVLQLVNTNEAQQKRGLEKAAKEGLAFAELDLTPKDDLLQMVAKAFPVQQFREDTDEDGNTIWVPVTDSEGNPVENPEAIAMREQLLQNLRDIRVPSGPLDLIVQEFGASAVAEVTGRKKQTVFNRAGEQQLQDKPNNEVEIEEFQSGKKKILVFSDAGGTGKSYHADLRAKNQDLRAHYLIQGGWNAAKAVQGFGRTHRSNQRQPPVLILTSTNLNAEMRFISSIAKRLDQLGALTRGNRDTGGQGLFSAEDNLENEYATAAVHDMFRAILNGRVDGITQENIKAEMGIDGLKDELTGEIIDNKLPQVKTFLNRLLSTSTERMNIYYDEFFDRLQANVQAAKDNGDYDAGLENLIAQTVEAVHEETVFTEQKSGAETKYVKLELTDPIIYNTFKDVVEMGVNTSRPLLFFARNNQSDRIYAFFEAADFTETTGNVRRRFRRVGVAGAGQLVNQDDVRIEKVGFREANYTQVEVVDAKTEWPKAIDEAPETRTWQENIITGAILPIWDRVIGRPRLFRVLTNDGRRMIGRVIAQRDLTATLNNLGAEGSKVTASHKQIIERVLKSDFTYRLQNRWRIKRAVVNGEKRIELDGPSFGEAEQVKADGVFTEIIQSRTRFFIPTKLAEGVAVLDRILEFRDVVDEVAPTVVEEQGTPYGMRADGNMDTRKMGTELLEINANAAAGVAQRVPEIETLATAINTEFIQDHTTSLVGKTVETAEDLATLAQVYRDPRYETLRYFVTDTNGRVLYQKAVSARMPASTAAFAVDEDVLDLAADIRALKGATNLWMLHNHPSGESSPGNADLDLTRTMADNLRATGLRLSLDHVVIDSNNYSHMQALIQPSGNAAVQTRANIKRNFGRDRLLEAALPHPMLGKPIRNAADVADVGAAVHKGSGWVTLVGATTRGKVRALGEFHESLLTNRSLLRKQLREFARSHGAADLFLVGVRAETMFKKSIFKKSAAWARDLVELGFVRDVLSNDGRSLRQEVRVMPPIGVSLGLEVQDETRLAREPQNGKYESDITRQQENIVEKVRKGQPLDRLMRFMFTGMGIFENQLLNEKGEFKLGILGLNRIKRALTEATFDERSPFRWMNGYLEHARHGLIDRYKVSDEFIQRGFEATAEKRRLLLEGLEFLNRLFESGVTTLDEAIVLQKMMTGEQVEEREWTSLALEVRQAIDSLGLEAVGLGLISRESYERNRGTYLHRVYVEYETFGDDNTLSRFMGRLMAGKKHAIKGDALRGRGIFQEVTQNRLLKDISSKDVDQFFGVKKRAGKPDTALMTKKFRVLDLFEEGPAPGTQPLPGVEEGSYPKKLRRRMWVPADKPIPARLSNYEDRGVFEVRRVSGNKLVMWRDFTKAERIQMGEILDARYTIAKTYHVMAQDLSSARFFRDIAQNKEWTWQGETAPPAEILAEHNTALRHYIGYEWVQVPTTVITKTGGKAKWGELAGKYVRAEIWKDLNEIDAMNQKGAWQTLLTQWKLNKTARHPVVHMNNVISNLTLMDLIDVRARDLWRGIQEYNERGELYQLMREHGGFGSDYITQEIKDNIFAPVLREMTKEAKQGLYEEGSFLKKLRFIDQYSRMASEGIQRLGKAIGNFDRASREWYRAEDEIFRMATFIRKLEQGEAVADAAALAREQFLNYDIRAPWVNKARRSVLPFIAYTYRAVPAIIDAMARRPWKMAKYALVAEMANALAYAASDGDEEWERASLRPEVRGDVWIAGVPRMMRMPVNDKFGNPIFLDIRRWIPAGDVFDIAPNNPMPIPAWLHFGGPIMIAGEMFLNRSAFTGDDIVDPTIDTLGDKTKKYGEFLWRSILPSAPWIYDSWYWNKLSVAIRGGRDQLGRPISIPSAVASTLGIKATPHDVELNFEYRRREFDRTERALKAALRLNGRDRFRGIVSKGEADRLEIELLDKMRKLNENRAKTFAPLLNRGR